MKTILVWKKDGKPDFSGEQFEIFRARWDKRERQWVEDETGPYWALTHPVTGRVVGLRKDPSTYGTVMEMQSISEFLDENNPNIETSVIIGTPSLGIVSDEEE